MLILPERGAKHKDHFPPPRKKAPCAGTGLAAVSYTHLDVYKRQALGLLVTFLTAVVGVYTGTIIYFFYLPAAPFLLLAIELVVVLVLSARLHKLSVGAARGMFFLYAILNGITFSVLLLAYDWGTMLLVFGITAVYFGALAAYGYLTKRDLTLSLIHISAAQCWGG